MNTSEYTLRSAADLQQMQIGAAVTTQRLNQDSEYRDTVATEFNTITAEYEMKFRFLQPEQGVFDFTEADELANFASENDMTLRGHTLVWHIDNPAWLENGDWSRDQLLDILETHIKTVVGRYKGQIEVWDVVNEAIDDSGNLRDTFWLREIGPEYIELAFQWAHEADPDALLYYNDYRISEVNAKSDAVYDLVSDLQANGVPIHGVGFQMHMSEEDPRNFDSVAENMQRLDDLGLEVEFTEADVRINTPTTEAELNSQAEIYEDIIETCLEADNCDSVTLWGFTDRYSWVPGFFNGFGDALIFDDDYQPKPAYDGILEALLSEPVSDPPATIAPTVTTAASVTLSENETIALDINSTDDVDSEGNGLTYSLSGGADAAAFSIDNNGVLSFNVAPDFETPDDANGDNLYDVEVTVTDSDDLTTTQTLSITVSDVDDTPDTPPVDDDMSEPDIDDDMSEPDIDDDMSEPDIDDDMSEPDIDDDMSEPDIDDDMSEPDIDDDMSEPDIDDDMSEPDISDPTETDGDSTVLDLGEGNNSIELIDGNYTITAGSGDDTIGLGTGVDTVNAGDGDNFIYMTEHYGTADGAKDILTGAGNDRVKAGSGDDRLDLGTARDYDIAFGRGGSDTFVLNQGSGYVIIRDFEQGIDQLDIGNLSFGTLEQSATNDKTFISAGGDTLAELTYFTGTLTAEDVVTTA